jgi:hypothetical protein
MESNPAANRDKFPHIHFTPQAYFPFENDQRSSGILGFGTWARAPPHPQISGFFYWGGIFPPILTNPDIISYAHLFPSEGIEIMFWFTNCTSK